jgi:NAD(P)-dependent dehydrogenase (short-subunit alcohol dehydrogenase family)
MEALRVEFAPLGIHTTVVDPGYFRTLALALLTIASQEPPPRRFIAGADADAIATAEQKLAALKEDIEYDRELSTSLDFDVR